jgi:N-glycosylase/DNA lyase
MKELEELYRIRKNEIKKRMQEFSEVYHKGNKKIFEELCFCILTANTSAEMGLNAMESLKDILFSGSLEEIQRSLKDCSYRYPFKRAEYIVEARETLRKELNFDIKGKIESFTDKQELRDYFVKKIKGFGYKEASHFLRNIGFKGYAILDKHILRSLCEFSVIPCKKGELPKISKKKDYIRIENKMKDFSKRIGIDFDELDLLLWSRKTGKILK